ncbi:MAG: type II secretion system ATPase GspE [Deltaproteobacteria bacterium]|nr:type II secretion system ATPase GspE [Deltaproteobacteria bacterium]
MGFIAEDELLKLLGGYFEYPIVSLKNYQEKNLFIEGLPEGFMREIKFVPLELKDNLLCLAIGNPFDVYALEAIRAATGYDLDVRLAKESEISDTLEKLFSTGSSSMERLIETMGKEEDGDIALDNEGDVDHLKDMASEAPVIRLVNMIISRAIELRASDIHFEPFEKSFHIRYRIDGVLHDMESPPRNLQAAVISRIKIMSKLNIAERRLPQDGRVKLRVMGKEIDFRVSTLPTLFGESVVMRILDSESIVFDLDSLGFPKEKLSTFEDLIMRPHGIILVTGPTGSGKTTTLYSALNKINSPEKKIITVEDPVEYQLHGVNQIHVKPSIGLTFSSALRSILRQDPDVVMIGEIRDAETAEIAIHAALTGHLVFSTLHTNDAAGAVTRLLEMGMENYLVSSSLIAIMAQRLVRVICPHCREEFAPSAETLQEMELDARSAEGLSLARGTGCDQCAGTGYQGRQGIYELLTVTDTVRELILSQADSMALKEAARKDGMQTLREAGWNKVREQKTTGAEVIRVTQVE